MPWSPKYNDTFRYKLNNAPIIDGNRVTISVEVEGLGDFCPNTRATSTS